MWFIHGNHDTSDSVQDFEHLWDSALADRNIHGRVVELPNGTRLASASGDGIVRIWDSVCRQERGDRGGKTAQANIFNGGFAELQTLRP